MIKCISGIIVGFFILSAIVSIASITNAMIIKQAQLNEPTAAGYDFKEVFQNSPFVPENFVTDHPADDIFSPFDAVDEDKLIRCDDRITSLGSCLKGSSGKIAFINFN
jgi:hypothetical protein